MEIERISLREIIIFCIIAGIFIVFGANIGWRVVGFVGLIYSILIMNKRNIGVGWEGFKPSFYLNGKYALIFKLFIMAIMVILLFFPEQTIMKLGLS